MIDFIKKLFAMFRSAPVCPPIPAKWNLPDLILLELAKGSGTAEEIAQRMKANKSSVATTLSGLKNQGKVKIASKLGRVIVWQLVNSTKGKQ